MRLPNFDQESDGLGLTPLIDVVFLLLIFFLVATRFDQEEKLVSINLAEILKAQPVSAGSKEIVVNVTDDGQYIVVDQTYNEEQLIALLHEAATNNPGKRKVQIRADQEVKFLYPLTVIGICKQEELEYYCTVLQKKSA